MSLAHVLQDAPGATAADRAAFTCGWFLQRSKLWLDTARACRLAGDRRRAAMHLTFAAELRRDGMAAAIRAGEALFNPHAKAR